MKLVCNYRNGDQNCFRNRNSSAQNNELPLTFGLVIAATLSILSSSITDYYGVGIFLFALLLKQKTKLNSALILLLSGLLGEVLYLLVK